MQGGGVGSGEDANDAANSAAAKANKGVILRKSVDYIRYVPSSLA